MDKESPKPVTFQPDELIEATLISDSLQGQAMAQAIMDEIHRRFTVVTRLKDNLSSCKQRIKELQDRNERIEGYLNAHRTDVGLGGNLDTTR